MPEPSADQELPSHLAMKLAGIPPAIVNIAARVNVRSGHRQRKHWTVHPRAQRCPIGIAEGARRRYYAAPSDCKNCANRSRCHPFPEVLLEGPHGFRVPTR